MVEGDGISSMSIMSTPEPLSEWAKDGQQHDDHNQIYGDYSKSTSLCGDGIPSHRGH